MRPDLTLSRRRALAVTAAAAGGAILSGQSPAAAATRPPVFFYSPHQDDEALGYAGQIRAAQAAGRPVVLVLVTQGQNGAIAELMNEGDDTQLGARCSFPRHYHALGWNEGPDNTDTPEVVAGRTAEFYRSARAMGVDQVINWAVPEIYINGQTYDQFVATVTDRLRAQVRRNPGAAHRFPAGWLDRQATHKAISDAAYAVRPPDSLFTYIHVYGDLDSQQQRDTVTADRILRIPDADMAVKRAAILAYNTYDPAHGLYCLGYHSYHDGLEQAYADPREWIYRLPADYQPGQLD